MSSIDPSEASPPDHYVTPKNELPEVRDRPLSRVSDSVENYSGLTEEQKQDKETKKRVLKEDADAALKRLEYLKKLVVTLGEGAVSPELQALLKVEKKIEIFLAKSAIIHEKTFKINAIMENYIQEMQSAVDALNQAIAEYNNTAPTPSGTALLEAAFEAYQQATASASRSYVKDVAVYNALVKTIPGINAELAALGLPKIAPVPTLTPPPISTSSGQYALPAPGKQPVRMLPTIPPFAPIPQPAAPISVADAVEISIGSAILALCNSISQPMNIQKHIDRQV